MTMILDFSPQRDVPAPVGHPWPRQGQWTYEDYCRLPEDGKIYEVIEGELLMSPAPRTRHQKCCGNLFAALWNYNKSLRMGEVLISPVDLVLPGLGTNVQPDIVFILKERLDHINERCIEGAPDLVVEVLSPWNAKIDRGKKFKVYAKAGVREYWIVDPDDRTVELYVLSENIFKLMGKYQASDNVCSRILPGFEVQVEEICPA